MNADALRQYVSQGGYDSVEGWLTDDACSATIAISRLQQQKGIVGDVAEIGVHHGKYFILLACLMNKDEQAYAMDVFEDQFLNIDHSGKGDVHAFKSNISKHSSPDKINIIKIDSKLLNRAKFFGEYSGRPIRIFSVDGSHTAFYTDSDLIFAKDVLSDGGVICLDDFFNAAWPGVQEGFYRFITKFGDDVAAFAYGGNKLFLSSIKHHSMYLDLFSKTLRPYMNRSKLVEINGRAVMNFALPAPAVLFDSDFGLGSIFRLTEEGLKQNLVALPQGWGRPQSQGTWTIGETSIANVKIPALKGVGIQLEIDAKPFLHENRRQRRLTLFCNGANVGSAVFGDGSPSSVQFKVPAPRVTPVLRLEFAVENPESPAEVSDASDRRRLGFFIRSISVSPHP